jgi:hypothetical protein
LGEEFTGNIGDVGFSKVNLLHSSRVYIKAGHPEASLGEHHRLR